MDAWRAEQELHLKRQRQWSDFWMGAGGLLILLVLACLAIGPLVASIVMAIGGNWPAAIYLIVIQFLIWWIGS